MVKSSFSRAIRVFLLVPVIALLGGSAVAPPVVADDTAKGETENDEAPGSDVPNLDARWPVVTLEDKLLAVMKEAETLGFEGRLQEIRPVVEATFDLEFMAKTSIGRVWKDLTPELKTQWVECFTRYTSTKLADQFDTYSGQRFVLRGERPASRGTLIVMTNVERPGKEDVRLDFRVRPMGTQWRIIDIYGKGKVSEVALRRSEYAAILEQSGIEGLLTSLEALSDRTAHKSGS